VETVTHNISYEVMKVFV